jgi:hypothetical protein
MDGTFGPAPKPTRFHDKMRGIFINVPLAAGLSVLCEPKGKLPGEPNLRPGDLCISAWAIDGIVQTEHCIGFGAPVVNSGWGRPPNTEKCCVLLSSAWLESALR